MDTLQTGTRKQWTVHTRRTPLTLEPECSLAIMTDAAHLLSDVGGFAVAIFAAYYAAKRSQQSHTFG